MKKIWCLIVMPLMVMLAIVSDVKAAKESYVYQSITKDVVVTYTEKVMVKENEIVDIMLSNNGEMMQTILGSDYATKNWELHNEEQDIKLAAQRSGNTIKVQGRFKGKEIAKEFKIDNRPWFQAWKLSFGPFVLSGETRQEFWTLRPYDLKECVMAVLREREETITINGQAVEAVKVKVTLNNYWMSKFWSVHYWLRRSDGVYLRSEGANGPPGTPITIMELVSEAL